MSRVRRTGSSGDFGGEQGGRVVGGPGRDEQLAGLLPAGGGPRRIARLGEPPGEVGQSARQVPAPAQRPLLGGRLLEPARDRGRVMLCCRQGGGGQRDRGGISGSGAGPATRRASASRWAAPVRSPSAAATVLSKQRGSTRLTPTARSMIASVSSRTARARARWPVSSSKSPRAVANSAQRSV